MSSEENRKRLERQARNLMVSREITTADRDKINAFMRDRDLGPEEKYKAIIKLLRNSQEKETEEITDTVYEQQPDMQRNQRTPVEKKRAVNDKSIESYASVPDTRKPYVSGPTETSLYINDIYFKYRRFKFFKKRYLVERDNWLGLGLNKRLIPSKKFFEVISLIRNYQETVLSRLPSLLESILKNEEMESPLEYNYLKMLRRWLHITLFAAIPPHRIKWLEQWGFEREFRLFTINHYAFLKMELKHRESLLALVEDMIRKEPDLVKDEISENEDRGASIKKEKSNYLKEKQIYEYMGAMRSFITIPGESDSLLASDLRKNYDIYSMTEFLNMSLEALVFQRPFAITELRDYYDIRPAAASSEIWDCSSEKLKASGKDPDSKRRKRLEKLKKDLLWYDTVYQIVNIDEGGQSIIVKSVEEQWKLADRSNRDAADSMKKNFIVFLEGAMHYFKNLPLQVLNGTPLLLEKNSVTRSGAVFAPEYFSEELRELELLMADLFSFRNHNPTLKISVDEAKKIMQKKISSMNHVETLMNKTGSVFYSFGKKLHEAYYNHDLYSGTCVESDNPLSLSDTGEPEQRCIPFAGYILRGVESSTPLLRRFAGQKILSDSKRGGILIFIMAYCYQMSNLCVYPLIRNDLTRRDIIRREMDELKGDEQ